MYDLLNHFQTTGITTMVGSNTSETTSMVRTLFNLLEIMSNLSPIAHRLTEEAKDIAQREIWNVNQRFEAFSFHIFCNNIFAEYL